MFFHSLPSLIIFLPIFFIGYTVIKKFSLEISKKFLLLFSLVFYGFDVPWFVIPLLISASSDYLLSKVLIEKKSFPAAFRKYIVCLSLIINIGLLIIFKYQNLISIPFLNLFNNFEITNLNNNLLPVGISFYTFQTLSFTIDCFRGKVNKCPKLIDYFLFVCYFPQLVAGPILRYSSFFDIKSELLLNNNSPNLNYGFYRICYGLFLKLCLADELARLNDIAFNSNYELLGALDAWTMAFGFGLQIYFDFSAYSHMAIGISNIIGLPIMENFNFPYNSKSASEFWKRWHISLSKWVSDYLYSFIKNNSSQFFYGALPLLSTWIIMGIWHGASLRFALWGLLNGFLILIHRLFKSNIKIKNNFLLNNCFWFINLFSLMSTWIYFRSSTWDQANTLFLKLFKINDFSLSFRENYYLFVFLFMITNLLIGNYKEYFDIKKFKDKKLINISLSSIALALSIIFINRQTSFIYFQF